MTRKKASPRQLVVLIGTVKGAFFYHADENRTGWRLTGPHLPGWEVYSLCGDPRDGRILAGTCSYTYGATIRVTRNLGQTWEEIERGPAYPAASGFKLNRIWQIVPGHPSQPDTWYAGAEEAGLFVSRDNGRTWTELDGFTRHPTRPQWFPGNGGMCLHTVLVDHADPQRLWVAASAIGVFRSDDGGVSWKTCNRDLPVVATGQPVETEVSRCVHKMVQDPMRPGVLYQQFHGGVFKSEDAGESWSSIADGLPSNFGFPMVVTAQGDLFLVPLLSDEQRFVPEGALKVYRSRDRGQTWQALTRGLPTQPQYVGVLRDAMAVDPLEPAGVYFGTTMGAVYCSADAGDTWRQLPGQFPRITTIKTCLL
ncbi:MAG TPA: hypothetical protein VLW52_12955 [Opitutaceae bacterium]|nr:hypothetical protein [Opitutaceae bacterium]